MAEIDLQVIHDAMLEIAFEAGRMILEANTNDISTGTKLNSVDIVTETDQAVEALISSRLGARFPDYAFVGEETYKPGETRIGDGPTFIVDPIDGTTNFVHGYPGACISLGFALARRPAVGLVYNPYTDELYTAVAGRGAHLVRRAGASPSPAAVRDRGERLPLRGKGAVPLRGLGAALVAVEWGSSRDGPNYELKTAAFKRLAASRETGGAMVHSLRSNGSAALNLAAVAAGYCDAYWEGGCWAWDVCAGWCILAEAGGKMVSGNPGNWEPRIDERVYLAVRGAPEGQDAFIKEFWGVIGDGKMDYPV